MEIRYFDYQWYKYQRQQRSEDLLIQRIKETYGSNLVIGYGQWAHSNPNLRNQAPIPSAHLIHKLSQHFTTF